ncbi:MAG: hypothetical protein ACOC2T_01345 [Planctomycetota bacterium]
MDEPPVSRQEYSQYLDMLIDRMEQYLDSDEGSREQLMREARELLELKDVYPDVYDNHRKIEGLVGDMMARKHQERFIEQGGKEQEGQSPGCLIGWLMGGNS